MSLPTKESREMKAWLVKDKDEYRATVVFVETRGKARKNEKKRTHKLP